MSNQDSVDMNNQYYESNEEQMNQDRNREMQEQINQQMYEDYINQENANMNAKMNDDLLNRTNLEQEYQYENTTQNLNTNPNPNPNMSQNPNPNPNPNMSQNMNSIKPFPRQVMTALGPLPLPEEFINNIPEKFVAKPIIEEREIYVSKKERKQREVEIPHVQYEHTFKNIRKQFQVSKLIPTVSEVVKEVPKEVLKPVIEEKIIEVPQGVKYVEVPVEVPCLYPPKIVPKIVTQYVERIVETVKPIVQEKIIEVPQTVIKQIPKIKTVEVPYFVPRYVEKIVEVPFRPNGDMLRLSNKMQFNISKTLPPLKPTHMMNENHRDAKDMNMGMNMNMNQTMNFYNQQQHQQQQMSMHMPMQMPSNQDYMSMNNDINRNQFTNINNTIPSIQMDQNIPMNQCNSSSRQNSYMDPSQMNSSYNMMMMNQMNQMQMNQVGQNQISPNMLNPNIEYRENLKSQIDNVSKRVNLPEGMHWGYPEGINKPMISNNQVPPLVITCPPEIGRVTCARKDIQPDILTKGGVFEFEGFKKKGTAQALFPPLAPHNRVPFLPPPAAPGTPDVRTYERH